MARRPKRDVLRPSVGDHVLIASNNSSMPLDWFLAGVLWARGDEILTEHNPPGGIPPSYRQVLDVETVRAVGTPEQLLAYRDRCFEAVRDNEQQAVRDAEQALHRAREAVYARLDQLGAGPVDFREGATP